MKRFSNVEADFYRFFNLDPLSISWRLFRNLLFGLVSEESSFYAPYLKEMYEDMREESKDENKVPRVQVSMEEALKELGIDG